MGAWLVGRAVREDFDEARVEEMLAWIRALGVDPTNIAQRAAVVHDDDMQHVLHLSEYVLDEHGHKFIDYAANEVVTRLIAVPVEPDSWPAWLTGMGKFPTDEVSPAYVHRLLDAFLTGGPLDFGAESVPADVQRRLTDARDAGTLGTVPA